MPSIPKENGGKIFVVSEINGKSPAVYQQFIGKETRGMTQ